MPGARDACFEQSAQRPRLLLALGRRCLFAVILAFLVDGQLRAPRRERFHVRPQPRRQRTLRAGAACAVLIPATSASAPPPTLPYRVGAIPMRSPPSACGSRVAAGSDNQVNQAISGNTRARRKRKRGRPIVVVESRKEKVNRNSARKEEGERGASKRKVKNLFCEPRPSPLPLLPPPTAPPAAAPPPTRGSRRLRARNLYGLGSARSLASLVLIGGVPALGSTKPWCSPTAPWRTPSWTLRTQRARTTGA